MKAFWSKTAAAARSSAESVAAVARSSVGGASTADNQEATGDDGDALRGRMGYIAVSRTGEMLAEVADREVPEVEKDYAIALGRKMIKRTAPPGWDEISSDRHRAIKFTIHDLEGCTSYTICFSHTFPMERAQAFVQKLALMLDPVIEKSASITISLIESTILIVLPVLERELERGNSGVKSYEIDNQKQEVKQIITQNVDIMLDRDEKLPGGEATGQMENAASMFKKPTRALKRFHLNNQVKWGVGPGTRFHSSAEDLGLPQENGYGNSSASTSAPTSTMTEPSKESTPKAQMPVGGTAPADCPKSQSSFFKAAQPQKPAKPTEPLKPVAPIPEPPPSPRTSARTLVGTKLSEEQRGRAADIILRLEPFVSGKRTAGLDEIWTFFDMQKPPGNCFREGDATAKGLRGKMNRQRLLLHPDKNMHPEAEKTFKFLEQCSQRLTQSYTRCNESGRQKVQREEEELRREQDNRRKQEEEWQATQEKIRQDEEDKWRQEERKAQKVESDRLRYEKMLRDKENMRQNQAERQEERVARARAPRISEVSQTFGYSCDQFAVDLPAMDEEAPCALPSTQPGLAPMAPSGNSNRLPAEVPSQEIPAAAPAHPFPVPMEVIGKLTLTVIAANNLPSGGLFTETDAYAMAGVGGQRCKTTSVPGSNPRWNCTFELDVHMEDQGLYVTLWREGWGFRLLGDDFLGRVELPFLDLDDWSGCVIGRVIEGSDPDAEPMVVELKASIEWV